VPHFKKIPKEACIKGTRITVGDILQWLSEGTTTQEILEDYPELQEVHIRAALAFAAERKKRITLGGSRSKADRLYYSAGRNFG
jgi:uncharacterized protein (DUF433 family)